MVLVDDLRGYQAMCDDDDEGAYDLHEEHLAMATILEGELKKKLLKRAGKSVSVSRSAILDSMTL